MPLPLKELAKLNQVIERIQAGQFDANDVDNLLMKLRPYAGRGTVFLEVANFVAHSDARDRGLAQQSITSFVDAIQYFREYVSEKRPLDLATPFPAYLYRLFLSQARLADERRLKDEHKMSCATLMKKIEANFSIDKKTGTCSLRNNKGGVELFEALRFVTGFIHSRAAFHVSDFHKDLKDVLRAQRVSFDEVLWDAQADRISLAILCLISNTEFELANGSQANCKLATENHFRLLSGQRRLPTGDLSPEPTSFGPLMVIGEATVGGTNMAPLRISFPLIDTNLDPHEHCHPTLFLRDRGSDAFAGCEVEIINFAPDMSMSADFKLVRTDSIIG
ncbi:hypothetical protein [Burkholderia cepacia]|uniref:hypothetical protein n=1 Tax=Burkholderia cepacia TaxID=292 RepID=UPI00075DEA97|nr:hypothetical protein [Burkholderia cepacia]KVX59264.1 hypothetical protein WL06_05505 [Burkholderia cepacia]KWD63451.1 hypothetical protein WL68_00830 [Burkholderia cepacia]KWD84356.1 hypothetical protein WL69_12385 [Burkholderia cepacia]